MVGGVISGYCAIGRLTAARRPSSTMMIEMTQAKTGLSTKNLANTQHLLLGCDEKGLTASAAFLSLARGVASGAAGQTLLVARGGRCLFALLPTKSRLGPVRRSDGQSAYDFGVTFAPC